MLGGGFDPTVPASYGFCLRRIANNWFTMGTSLKHSKRRLSIFAVLGRGGEGSKSKRQDLLGSAMFSGSEIKAILVRMAFLDWASQDMPTSKFVKQIP